MDVNSIVIGSGAGGLTAALALARGGDRVLVLEQHYLPGGWCHSFPLTFDQLPHPAQTDRPLFVPPVPRVY